MKKHHILLVCGGMMMTTIASASEPQANLSPPTYRHTPYIGIGIGGINAYHNANISLPAASINKFSLSEQSFSGELMAGWLFRLPSRWQLGLETNYSISPNEADALINGNPGSGTKIKVGSDWAWGGGIRLGYMLSKVSTLYIKAGFEYRQFQTRLYPTINSAASIDNKLSKVTFAPAVGFEVNVAPRWAVGGEFRSARYGTMTNKSTDQTNTATIKPRVDTYMINLKYKFWTNEKK